MTALVTAADAPPDGAPHTGRHSQGSIRVLVDTPTGRRQLGATFGYADDHWLVAGMDAPVYLDPADPDTFEVDWAAVPSMKQQVEANHPALADPFATSRRIAQALGITPSEKTAAQAERFEKAVAEAASKPAPAGKVRAVAMLATVRGRYGSYSGGDNSTGNTVELTSPSAAVLSVVVPGAAPYAAYLPKFAMPRGHIVIPGDPMPVLVSATDRSDVKILWDEAPSLDDQIGARIADSMQASTNTFAAMATQMQADQAAAIARASEPGAGAPAAASPEMRQMMVDNLKRSLVNVTDPAVRQQVLNQYTAMGFDITAEELGY